ncbi:hypothetical protein N9W79_02055 [bacterium]|nr:hypothetical protein [bacterium]
MKKISLLTGLIVLNICLDLVSLGSSSASASILPRNNLHLEDHPAFVANLTQVEFNAIIERVEDYYTPVVESHGGVLRIEKRWDDKTVNAFAERNGNFYNVSMFGGLARRAEVTHDGFMLVVCHELGHHLAGYPFVSDWASNEGQSDYFATQSCARNIWKDDIATNASFRSHINRVAKKKCDAVYAEAVDQELCYRIAAGGESLAALLSVLGRQRLPSFATPDSSEVLVTSHGHPNAQCRLDTYLAGALCTVEFDENIIPGLKFSDEWLERNLKMEGEALIYSCSQTREEFALSKRPKCWFGQLLK